jgi:transcriptional regulator with XRE-family HTH domain/uncharacterized cupin superfamily protein
MPVYNSVALDYAALGLGERIRAERKRRGWTLQELAAKVEVSPASLSAIENDKAILDLDRLVAITQALGVTPHVVLPGSSSSHYLISRRAGVDAQVSAPLKVVDPSRGASTSYHNLLKPLADAFVGKHLEPFYIEVQPVSDDDLQFISHHHEEFFFVLAGEIECVIKTPSGLIREVLRPGDSMHFWSYLPHCIRSTGPDTAHSLHLLHAAHGASESEYSIADSTIYFRDASHKTLGEQIGSKVASLRQARGMSVGDLAQTLEVGVRQMADLERGRKAISIELLLRICRLFRKPAEYFLASTLVDPPFFTVLRASAIAAAAPRRRRTNGDTTAHATYKPLSDGFAKGGMYPYYVRLPLVPGESPPLREHHGQEFVYVLNGQVQLHTMERGERVTHNMWAGDSCFIDSTVPHRIVGVGLSPSGESAAELIDVFWCPLGEAYLFTEDVNAS